MNLRYQSAVASMKVLGANALLEISKDDLKFITTGRIWQTSDRARGRRIIESIAFGSLDATGLPRFPLPAEFVATVIAIFVHPENWLVACNMMEGAEWSENIVNKVEEPLKAETLFAMVIEIEAGEDLADAKQRHAITKLNSNTKAT